MHCAALRFCIVVGLSVLLVGCGLVDTSEDKGEARFELNKTDYRADATIRASFINASNRPLYIVEASCRTTGIQKMDSGAWKSLLEDPPIGAMCTAVVRYTLVEAGETVEISILPEYLAGLVDTVDGTYRFHWKVSPERSFEGEKIASAHFRVED